MEKINIYINEKLHIKKGMKVKEETSFNKAIEIIQTYLNENDYFGFMWSEFDIGDSSTEEMNNYFLKYPKILSMTDIFTIGKELEKILNEKLHLSLEWGYNSSSQKIIWNDYYNRK